MLNIADEKGKGGNKYNDRNSGMEDEPDFTDPKGYVDEITDEGMMYAVCKRCYFENEQICFAKKIQISFADGKKVGLSPITVTIQKSFELLTSHGCEMAVLTKMDASSSFSL